MRARLVSTVVCVAMAAATLSGAVFTSTSAASAATVSQRVKPDLFCPIGEPCGTWQFFNPGEYCVSIYPYSDNGSCTSMDIALTYGFDPNFGTFQNGCEGALAFAALSVVWAPVGGEVAVGNVVLSCIGGGVWALLP